MISSLPLPSEPLVSVIVPMFNAREYIRETLDSVLAQSYTNLEIFVVDDGSTDDSASIVLSYEPKVRYVYQQSSRNAAVPRNLGFQLCRGDLVTFFDADDIMLRGKIEVQIDFLRRNPDVAIVLTDYVDFTAQGDHVKSHFETCPNLTRILQMEPSSRECILEPEQARHILTSENFFITDSPLLRRELIQRVGVFDPSVTPSEDFELVYRIAMNHRIGILNCMGFRRRLHDNNTTKDTKRVLAGLINSREKLLNQETSTQLRRQLEAFIADRYCDRCEYYIGIDNKRAFLSLMNRQHGSLHESLRPILLLLKIALSVLKSPIPGKRNEEKSC